MSRLAALEQRFNALQPRERLLTSLAIGVLSVLAMYIFWVEPSEKAAATTKAEITTLAPQVDVARATMDRLRLELGKDPEGARRAQLEQLREEAGRIDAELRAGDVAVIPPERMPAVLRELVGRDTRLMLVGIASLPPEVLRWTPADAAAAAAPAAPVAGEGGDATQAAAMPIEMPSPEATDAPALFRHRTEVRFEGDFNATLDYVRALEALPQRVRLRELEIDARRWPRLMVRLQVETLGVEEGWIGV